MEMLSPKPCKAMRSSSSSVSGVVSRSLPHSPREKRRNGERSITPASSVMLLPELPNRTHLVSPGGGEEQIVADQLLQGARYLVVGLSFQRVAEVAAVDLPVPQKRAEARVEHAGVG